MLLVVESLLPLSDRIFKLKESSKSSERCAMLRIRGLAV